MRRVSIYVILTFICLIYCAFINNAFAAGTLTNVVIDSSNKTFINLIWSKNEIEQAVKIFHGKSFLYQNASKANFQKYSADANIVHLATHTIIDDQNPMFSKLIFASSKDDHNDRYLHTYELFNMNLNAELTVLSACNTGVGKLIHGEGIMSLARGFRYAGCPNIVMSLWQVDDLATAKVMKNFYDNLVAEMGKTAALRAAKLSYLENEAEIKAAPYYWAGFILIGDNEPLHIKPIPIKRLLIILLGLTIAFLLLLFLSKKFRNLLIPKHQLYSFIFLLFISFFAYLFCQQYHSSSLKKDSTPTKPNNNQMDNLIIAENLFREAKYDSSIYFFNQYREQFYEKQQWKNYIICLNGIGKNYIYKTEYDSALYFLNQALQLGETKLPTDYSLLAQIYNNLGTLNRKQGNLSGAIQLYRQAINAINVSTINDSLILADIYQNLAASYYSLAEPDSTALYNNKSISIRQKILGEASQEIAQNYTLYGLIYLSRGNFDKALQNYQKSLQIRQAILRPNHPDIAQSYINLGVIYYQKGDYDRALDYHQKALKIKLQTVGRKNISIAGGYLNIGVIADKKGDYNKALEFYFQSSSILKEIGIESHALMGDIYNNIGIAYKNLNKNKLAIDFYQKALKIYVNAYGEHHPKVANLYLNLGILHSVLRNHLTSLQNFRLALNLSKKIYSNNHPQMAVIYLNMGIEYLQNKNYQKAERFLNKTLLIGHSVFGTRHPIIAEAYQELGQLHLKQNDFYKALKYFQKSLIALTPNFDNEDYHINPDLSHIIDAPRFVSCLALKALAFEKVYDLNSHQLSNLIYSIENYKLAIELIQKISTSYTSETAKFTLGEKTHEIFANAVRVAFKLFSQTNDIGYKDLAFFFAEKSKANILRQTLLESRAKKFGRIPDSLLQLEKQLKIDITFYKQLLFEKENKSDNLDSTNIISLQNKLFSLNRNFEALIKKYECNYPKYYELKYESKILTPDSIQRLLVEPKSTILEYFLSGDSLLFIFTITSDHFEIKDIKIDSSFFYQINEMKKGIIDRDYFQYSQNAHLLYQSLITPVKALIKDNRLIIIPDNILGYIPFEVLISHPAPQNKKNYHSLSYLIKDFQISYNYSAAFINPQNKSKTSFRQQFVGFAPVVFK